MVNCWLLRPFLVSTLASVLKDFESFWYFWAGVARPKQQPKPRNYKVAKIASNTEFGRKSYTCSCLSTMCKNMHAMQPKRGSNMVGSCVYDRGNWFVHSRDKPVGLRSIFKGRVKFCGNSCSQLGTRPVYSKVWSLICELGKVREDGRSTECSVCRIVEIRRPMTGAGEMEWESEADGSGIFCFGSPILSSSCLRLIVVCVKKIWML